jgi:ParB-like chromosome segregation protein Spo0J
MGSGAMETSPGASERIVAITTLGEKHAGMRLSGTNAVKQMQQSLRGHGQLCAIAVYAADGGTLEVVDGFKRLRAARDLKWSELRVSVLATDAAHALAAIELLNARDGLTELEEGWICRALHREQRMLQQQIAQLLGRHKSWVCRRLMLVEGLDEPLQADVRLGLLAPRTAIELSRLPRGNQPAGEQVVLRRGLTAAQTATLVGAVLARPDAASRAQWLADALGAPEPLPSKTATPRTRTPADVLLGDLDLATRVAVRLQVRLRERPLTSYEPGVAALMRDALHTAGAVLARTATAVERTASEGDVRRAAME